MSGKVSDNLGRSSGLIKAAAAGGAMTMIKRQVLNEADTDLSEIEFVHGTSDVVFDGTYDMYICMMSNILPASNDVILRCQIRDSSGYKTSSYTTLMLETKTNGSTTASTSVGDTASMIANEKFHSESYRTGHGYIMFPNPVQDTSTNTYYTTQSHITLPYGNLGYCRSFVGGGAYTWAEDYTGFKLLFSSGDIKSMIATLYSYNIS